MTACANIDNCISKKVPALSFQSTNGNRWALRRTVAKCHNNRALKITKEVYGRAVFQKALVFSANTRANAHLAN